VSAGLKKRTDRFHIIKGLDRIQDVENKLKEIEKGTKHICLMLDGLTLEMCMNNPQLEKLFFTIA